MEMPPEPERSSPMATDPAPSYDEVTVQEGDTLTALADQYGTTVDALVHLNNIKDPNVILPGQLLQVPKPGSPPVATGEEGVNEHTVQEGDTLTSIAAQFHTTVERLCWLNNIDNPDIIIVGQILRLPVEGEEVATTHVTVLPG